MEPGAPFQYFFLKRQSATAEVMITDKPSINQEPSHLRGLNTSADLGNSRRYSFEMGVVGCCCGGLRSSTGKYRFVAKLIATIGPRSMNVQVYVILRRTPTFISICAASYVY